MRVFFLWRIKSKRFSNWGIKNTNSAEKLTYPLNTSGKKVKILETETFQFSGHNMINQ